MKTAQELAQIILNKRNSLNPLIMPGQLIPEIGSDGLQEALRRRWLIPDQDSGYLQVSNQLSVVEDIRKNAAICEACGEQTCVCKERQQESQVSATRQAVMEHAHVKPMVVESIIQEIAAPGTGKPAAGFAPVQPNASPTLPPTSLPPTSVPHAPAPPPNMPTSARAGQSPQVGDPVLVTQEGKVFSGVVGGFRDGKYTVSFGAEKPPREMQYGPDQIRLVNPQAAAHA